MVKRKTLGTVKDMKNIKAVHEGLIIEWDNGEFEAIWGGCKERLRKDLNEEA